MVMMGVRLLSLDSAQWGTSTGAVFVVLSVIILLLSALIAGSIVTAALGVRGHVWRCMFQIVTPP